MKSLKKFLLPFLLTFGTTFAISQFKTEANLKEIDLKSKYSDFHIKDTLSLENISNARFKLITKYEDNLAYFKRDGVLNYSYGIDFLKKGPLKIYANFLKENVKNETEKILSSPIGEISTKTSLLNTIKSRDIGLSVSYKKFSTSYEYAESKNKIDGETTISIGEEKESVPFSFESFDKTNIYGINSEFGFFKAINNSSNGNNFFNFLSKASYSGVNIYYWKDFAVFLSPNFFKFFDINLIYDRKTKLNISTKDYSNLNQKLLERNIEDKLREVPRINDAFLSKEEEYLSDMFFTKDISFSLDLENPMLNVNLNNFVGHYSNDSKKIGLKYWNALVAYDFKKKSLTAGIFIE